jgi:hypothetical protein
MLRPPADCEQVLLKHGAAAARHVQPRLKLGRVGGATADLLFEIVDGLLLGRKGVGG